MSTETLGKYLCHNPQPSKGQEALDDSGLHPHLCTVEQAALL